MLIIGSENTGGSLSCTSAAAVGWFGPGPLKQRFDEFVHVHLLQQVGR